MTGKPDQPRRNRLQRSDAKKTADQILDVHAGLIVVGEGCRELLLVVGVAHTQGQIELVGDVEDIVGEKRPVGIVLPVAVVNTTLVADAVELIERSVDRRGSRAEGGRSCGNTAG